MKRFIVDRLAARKHGAAADELTYAFERLLGETAASARRLLYDWFFYRRLENASWTGGGIVGAKLLDARRVGKYLGNCPRGVVIATIHQGDYLEGLRQLRIAAAWRKRVFVVRRRGWSAVEERAFARVASDVSLTVLRTGRGAAATAVRELKRGNVLVALFDLPQRFGRPIEVEFLGQRANFVRGPAEIAVLGCADILPMFTHYDEAGSSIVEAMPVVATRPASCRHARVDQAGAISQLLCRLAEQHIRAHPSQWAHWSLINELMTVRRHRRDVEMTPRG